MIGVGVHQSILPVAVSPIKEEENQVLKPRPRQQISSSPSGWGKRQHLCVKMRPTSMTGKGKGKGKDRDIKI